MNNFEKWKKELTMDVANYLLCYAGKYSSTFVCDELCPVSECTNKDYHNCTSNLIKYFTSEEN